MTEKTARITINTYYENLQHAKTTRERYQWLNRAIAILNDFPALGEYFTTCDTYSVAGRLRRTPDFEDFDLFSVPRFNDGIDRETEKTFKKIEGLYFIGEVTMNPLTKEILYWVKIGYSSNLMVVLKCIIINFSELAVLIEPQATKSGSALMNKPILICAIRDLVILTKSLFLSGPVPKNTSKILSKKLHHTY